MTGEEDGPRDDVAQADQQPAGEAPTYKGRPVTGLAMLQGPKPPGATAYPVHLVRAVRGGGTPGATLCGLTRFGKDAALPGFSVGGGVSGNGVRQDPCDRCARVAVQDFPGIAPMVGVGAKEMNRARERAYEELRAEREAQERLEAAPAQAEQNDERVASVVGITTRTELVHPGPIGEQLDERPPAPAPFLIGEPTATERALGLEVVAAVDAAVALIRDEVLSAMLAWGTWRNEHEALGYIREEYREFEDEVFGNKHPGAGDRQEREATQLGATAARFLVDIRGVGRD